MNAAEDEDAIAREVIAGLRAQLSAVEKERDAAHERARAVAAELDALKNAVAQLSAAWRHLTKNLG